MIFIGIVDPLISKDNLGLKQQLEWIKEYCNKNGMRPPMVEIYKTRDDQGNQEDISNKITDLLKSILLNNRYLNESVYLYVNTHGITEEQGESLELNKKSYIPDSVITALFYNNKVKHLTVFFECCHSGGFFQKSENHIIKTKRFMLIPGYNYCLDESGFYNLERNNILVFNTSLQEQKSYQMSNEGNQEGIGLATLKLKELKKNIFEEPPEFICQWLNKQIGEEQYSNIQTTKFIPKWF